MSTGEVRLLALLTKADKLSRRESEEALSRTQQELQPLSEEPADVRLSLFSALKGTGLEDVAQTLRQWCKTDAQAANPPSLAAKPSGSRPEL